MHLERKIPTASVILPVYNAGKYLDAAIESVLGQTFTDFELLLLNDGSTDGSLARLEYYAAQDSRCRLFSWPNQGLVATLNEGIRLARADILLRMDADDLCRPERFERQVTYLQANPECVALGTRVMLIDPEGQPLCLFAGATSHEQIDSAHLAGRGGAIAHPSTAVRKTAVVHVGGYRANFVHAEDIDLFLRLSEVGRLANLPEVLFDYRQHPSSIGYRHAQVQFASTSKAVAEARFRRGLDKIIQFSTKETSFRTVSLADVHRKWSWWALSGGNLATARKHAFQALVLQPFDIDNFKLVACVLRGH